MTGPARTSEWSVALFLLGLLVFAPPFLRIFGAPGKLFGLPPLFVYLFAAWGALIALVALVAEGGEPESEPPGDPGARQGR